MYRKNRLGESFVCISHLKKDHYVILYDATGNKVQFCDPPKLRELDTLVFEKAWDGKVLLISNMDLRLEEDVSRHRWIRFLYIRAVAWFLILLAISSMLFMIRTFAKRSRLRLPGLMLYGVISTVGVLGCDKQNLSNPVSESTYGGSIKVEPEKHDLGVVLGGLGKTLKIKTKITNEGDQKLLIDGVDASCECTSVKLAQNELRPGASVDLETEIKTGEISEPRISRINLRSSDKNKHSVPIQFEWKVENPLSAERSSYEFLELPKKEFTGFQIPVYLKSMGLCENCRVECDHNDDAIQTTWKPRYSTNEIAHKDGLHGGSNLLLGTIDLRLLSKPDDFQYDRMLELRLVCRGELRARSVVPVRWSFERPIIVAPSRLSLGKSKVGDVISKEIFVQSAKKTNFRIKSVSCEGSNLGLEASYPTEVVSEAFVTLKFIIPDKKGPLVDYIIIQTDIAHNELVRIPISCLIE